MHLTAELGLTYKELMWKQVLKGPELLANFNDLAGDLVAHSEFSLRDLELGLNEKGENLGLTVAVQRKAPFQALVNFILFILFS